MGLDSRTLLFALMVISGLIGFSLAVVSAGENQTGLWTWARALAVEASAWGLVLLHGSVPYWASPASANVLLAAAQAMKIAAVHAYKGRPWPGWRCALPVVLMAALMFSLPQGDFRGRVLYGGMIYGLQLLILLDSLRPDGVLRRTRAWRLLFGAALVLLPLLVLRGLAAALRVYVFAAPDGFVAPNIVQVTAFMCVLSLDIVGSLGFVLMTKERSDFELRALAMVDFLTHALNRRAFVDRAEKELALCRRTGASLALLMIDVDHFKRINDNYGHAAGDAVLVALAAVIGGRIRKQDTLGRYGGEEFAVLLPGAGGTGAMVVAEALRKAVAAMPVPAGDRRLAVTVSIGVAVCSAPCASLEPDFGRLLEQADGALYQAKRAGRDRVIMGTQREEPAAPTVAAAS